MSSTRLKNTFFIKFLRAEFFCIPCRLTRYKMTKISIISEIKICALDFCDVSTDIKYSEGNTTKIVVMLVSLSIDKILVAFSYTCSFR